MPIRNTITSIAAVAAAAFTVAPAASQAAALRAAVGRTTPARVASTTAVGLQTSGSTGVDGSASDEACYTMVGQVNQLLMASQVVGNANYPTQATDLKIAADTLTQTAEEAGCILA